MQALRIIGLVHAVVAGAHFSAAAAEDGEAPRYHDHFHLLRYLNARGEVLPVRSDADWQKRRRHIIASMEQVMGPFPAHDRESPLDLRVTATTETPKYIRHTVTFVTEPGDRLPGYLLMPRDDVPGADANKRRAAILCLHQTVRCGKDEPAGLDGSPNLHYAAELAERGYVTLAVDYPNYGTYKFDAYAKGYASATMKGIYNHVRAVDLLQSLEEVDGERIGVIGHSLGGHNSLFLAAFDERILCVVTSCGFNSFRHYRGGDLTGWSHGGYMPRIRERYELNPDRMPFDFTEVLAAVAPRAALVVAPLEDSNFPVKGVRVCHEAANPVFALLNASDALRVEHPDCGHDFPPHARELAYDWFDRWLSHSVTASDQP